jgi:WD40 repeat protein
MKKCSLGVSFLAAIALLPGLTVCEVPKYRITDRFPFPIWTKPAARLKFRGACTNLDISPDGRYAAVVADRIYLVDIARQNVVASTEVAFPTGLTFSPDNNWLARRGPKGPKKDDACHVAIFEASTLKPVKVPLEPAVAGSVSWSSDGAFLAVGMSDSISSRASSDTVVWSAADWSSPGKIVRPYLNYPEATRNRVKTLTGCFLGRDLYIVTAEEIERCTWRYHVEKYVAPEWRLADRYGPITEKASEPAMFAYDWPHVPDSLFFYQWFGFSIFEERMPEYPLFDPRIWSFSSTTKQFSDWGRQKVFRERVKNICKQIEPDKASASLGGCIIFPGDSTTLFVYYGPHALVIRKTNKGFELNDFDYDGYPISRVDHIIPNKKWLVVELFNDHLTPPGDQSGLIGGSVIGVLDLRTGKRVGPTYYHPSHIFSGCVKATPDGKYVLVGYEDGSLLFWPIMPDAAQENK